MKQIFASLLTIIGAYTVAAIVWGAVKAKMNEMKEAKYTQIDIGEDREEEQFYSPEQDFKLLIFFFSYFFHLLLQEEIDI